MRKVFTILLLCPLYLFAQEKPAVDANYYVGEDGKLYWHGKKPVYIFIADNPEGANAHKLESQIHPQFTNPLYLDTEGINYFRTNWAADSSLKQMVPKVEVLFEVYRDSNPPVTSVSYTGAQKFKGADGVQYYGKNLSLSAVASDKHSGVQKTFYSIDNAPFAVYSDSIPLNTDKKFDVKVYSADNTGNVEAIQMFDFVVDMKSPVSEYSVHNDRSGMIFSPRTYLKIKSTDLGSGISKVVYQIDDQAEKTFTDQINLSTLSDGNHKIKFYAYDNVKNKEEEQIIDFYLDSTVPTVEATVVGDQYQNRGRVFISTRTKVKLVAEDNKAGVKTIKYSINGAEPETYYEPFELNKEQGHHVVTYFATDKVNNTLEGKLEEANLSRSSLDIDMVAPEISYDFKGRKHVSRDTTFVTSQSEIALSALDKDSGIKDLGYKINGGQGQTYSGPIKLEEEGFYTIDFYGTDQVNNRNTKSFFFVVDNTGPAIEHILSMEPIGTISLEEKSGVPIKVYSQGVKLFLGATDKTIDTDKVFYTLDNQAEIEYIKPITIQKKGLVTYQVRATDKLGNETRSEKFEIFIK
ncbi:Ig-like domain-containing protein [Reichenbachiella agarivorans]|uniref:Ig-like domain-containing protein n=1 Tax=Reichenbachiella agarivorans TaxID=2979464 RepID=A0ABY6CW15_9BACT|nr:Ig-like domain-containing protein [Reichenbachiella agarivorans]UXP33583.1 Ig-like domain-containing protein [Reichenbachiella agarivorans]